MLRYAATDEEFLNLLRESSLFAAHDAFLCSFLFLSAQLRWRFVRLVYFVVALRSFCSLIELQDEHVTRKSKRRKKAILAEAYSSA